MDLSRVDKEYNIIKNLRQYKNFSDSQLKKVATVRAMEYYANVEDLFTNPADKKQGKLLLKKYLNDFIPESISDLNTLRDIIFLEIINGRFQIQIDETQKMDNASLRLVDTIHKNLVQIQDLKKSLYITRNTRKSDTVDGYSKIDMLKKQFKTYLAENQASRNCTCPYCGQMFLLRLRMKYWEEKKHPFFKDRVLGNKKLIELYFDKKLTQEDIEEILECGDEYLQWLIKKWGLTKKNVREN